MLGRHLPETMGDVVWQAERYSGWKFLFLTLLLARRTNCCSFVKYEELDEEGGFHSSKKSVPNPSVKSFKV